MWERISPADIEQAKEQLAARHVELLARHQNEIQGLDAEEAQIDQLAQLVEAFIVKFNTPAEMPVILAEGSPEPVSHRRGTSLEVGGFGRPVLPAELDPRLTVNGAVSIDFHN